MKRRHGTPNLQDWRHNRLQTVLALLLVSGGVLLIFFVLLVKFF